MRNEDKIQLTELWLSGEEFTPKQIAAELGLDKKVIRDVLSKMLHKGLAAQDEPGLYRKPRTPHFINQQPLARSGALVFGERNYVWRDQ